MVVLLLHPIGLDADCWRFMTSNRLADSVRPTLLWHGGRSRPAVPPSLQDFAEDVLDNTSGPLDIVGLSMGAYVAMEIALSRPDRVRSLLVAGTSGGVPDPSRLLARAVAVREHGMKGVLDDTLARWFSDSALADPRHPGVAYAREALTRCSPDAFAAAWEALASSDVSTRLARLHMPATVVQGDADASVGLEAGRALAERIVGSRYVVIPAPHMMQLEEPVAFQNAILDHLDRVDQLRRHR